MSAMAGLVAAGIGGVAACDSTAGTSQPTPGSPTTSGASGASGAPTSTPSANGALGANFNGDPSVMTGPELHGISANWVRGFFAMPDATKGNPADQPAIAALLGYAGQGFGTVLSLKFPYFNQAIPTPGSPEMAAAQQQLDAVLAAVMNRVDILAIGNEPFIECRQSDKDSPQLNAFYEAMAQRAIAYRASKFGSASKTQLYMGALNHLDLPQWKTAATDRWMRFVHDTPEIAGTDIHPHLPDPAAGQDYLDYILPRMRSDQKFLATEFSLVLFYKKHLSDRVSAEFAKRYQVKTGTPVWQVINDALQHPVPQQEWDDFLAMTPWFANNKSYLTDQVNAFRATGKLAVATYGIGQDTAMSSQFGPDSTPWVLNSMYCQHTVQPAADGLPGQNTVWTNEFRSLQHT
jgi:hypothetical protein